MYSLYACENAENYGWSLMHTPVVFVLSFVAMCMHSIHVYFVFIV